MAVGLVASAIVFGLVSGYQFVSALTVQNDVHALGYMAAALACLASAALCLAVGLARGAGARRSSGS